MKRIEAFLKIALWMLAGMAVVARGQIPPKPDLPGALPRYQWCLVEAPMEYVQYAPYETRTWTFRHPGATSMKVRFESTGLMIKSAGYPGENSRIEILDGRDRVVQILTGSAGAFDTVSVTGGVIKVRYLNNANGGGGTLFAGAGDRFRVAGYKYYRSILVSEGGAGALGFQVMSPLPLPAQPLKTYRYNACEIPLAVKKPFNWGAQDGARYKVDFFLDGIFLGSSAGYAVAGDRNSIYFGVQLDMAQWLSQHGGRASTLCIRETRHVPGNLTAWRTGYQYFNLPMSMGDDRCVYTNTMTLEAVSPVTAVGRWFHLPNHAMVHAAAQWVVAGGSPGVDVRLRAYALGADGRQQQVAESFHPGVNQGGGQSAVEALSLWLPPGYYRLEMSRTTGSCAGFGYTARMYVRYDPEGSVLYY
ncbi:MAG TPA: hypothetical protein P5567_05515 [Kiritimatiellia bacterium]|nr:hypothetical protein [Kiritimatiellia bacterium]HSA17298.1 hypothetical protein [Kiritimatiellia bacterium]